MSLCRDMMPSWEWRKLAEDQEETITKLRVVLRNLLDASERHIFSTECQAERDAARAALGERT